MPARARRARSSRWPLPSAALTGCDGRSDDGAAEPPDELGLHDGRFCPDVLPPVRGDEDPSERLEPATELPSFPEPTAGRLCRYRPRRSAPRGTSPALFTWVLTGAPRELTADETATVITNTNDLELFTEAERACPADLGGRATSSPWQPGAT